MILAASPALQLSGTIECQTVEWPRRPRAGILALRGAVADQHRNDPADRGGLPVQGVDSGSAWRACGPSETLHGDGFRLRSNIAANSQPPRSSLGPVGVTERSPTDRHLDWEQHIVFVGLSLFGR